MRTSIVAHEEPHLSIRLEYMADQGEGPLDLAEQAITAIDALSAGWLEPLAWEMDIECLDTDLMSYSESPKPSQSYWLLCKEEIPAEVEVDPIYGNHTVGTEPILSPDRLRAWVARALAQTCPDAPRLTPCWGCLYALAMRARFPGDVVRGGHDGLRVDCYAGTITIPVEHINGQFWASGPSEKYTIGPPVRLTVSNVDGMYINLDLAVYWSLWIRNPAGRALVDAAVERVLALGSGWQRSA